MQVKSMAEELAAAFARLDIPDAICQDNHKRCVTWAKEGECQKNLGYMQIECRDSCGLCPHSQTVRLVHTNSPPYLPRTASSHVLWSPAHLHAPLPICTLW